MKTKRDVPRLVSATTKMLWNAGIDISPNKVSRLVRRFVNRVDQENWNYLDFLSIQLQLTTQQQQAVVTSSHWPEVINCTSYDPTQQHTTFPVSSMTSAGLPTLGKRK